MGGYIGAKTGTLVASASDIRGDISATDTTPEIVLKNTTQTDADGGREGTVTFKGEKSGGEEVTLAQIEGSHDDTSDDSRGQLVFKTNNNQLGDNVTQTKMTIDSVGDVDVTSGAPSITITNTTHEDTDGGREGKLKFKGEQSGGELSTLAQIEASHDGTADDQKGDLIFKTNDGSDGVSPTEAMRITSQQRVGILTNDPSDVLHVKGGASTDGVLIQTPLSGSVYNAKLEFSRDGESGGAKIQTERNASSGGVGLSFSTTADNSAEGSGTYTQRMKIDEAGKVGIGVSPSQKLHVEGAGNQFIFLNNSSTNDGFYFKAGTGASSIQTNGGSNILNLFTGGAERMRIDSSGTTSFHGISGRSSGSVGHLSISEQSNNRSYLETSTTTTSSMEMMAFLNPNGKVGTISISGSSTSYNTSSDYRLKENVTDVTDGITRVKQLAPKRFNFIVDADKTVDGFLAHETQAVVAEAVHGTKDELEVWAEGEELPDGVSVGDNKLDDDGKTIAKMQGIDQSKLVPLLTAALQEAIAKIETLETKVAALEAG